MLLLFSNPSICLQASLFLFTAAVPWITPHIATVRLGSRRGHTPFLWTFICSKCNFPEVSQQASHGSHWSELCHVTIPKPILGKWNGIIIIPFGQSSFLHCAGEGLRLPRKHFAAWHLNTIWLLLAEDAWLVCTQPWCLPQQGSPHGSPVLPVVIP